MATVRLDLTERVAWVTMDQGPLNVIDAAVMQDLADVLDEAFRSDASVVVLGSASTRAFSAGVDVAAHTPNEVEKTLRAFHGILIQLAQMPQTTVAAIDGMALGGGLELAMACDIAVASEDSVLGLPEIKLGCFPPMAVAVLADLCGTVAAADLILTGASVQAARAREMGIISRVYQAEHFDDSLRTLVTGLTQRSPAVLRMTTGLLRKRWAPDFAERLREVERFYLSELAALPDMAEGIAAFMQKREPKWLE